ncbi:glyoxalase [Thalassospira lucentensis]|uniref:Glyoxalase n=2 Tax=Thalassospira TaxID=168934 RepID=A0A367WZT7_9PROT|nr:MULTISPECIES: VOC family protein [Thalassospira]KZB55690.1 glyoxalase [Thalassospira xiamenensis]KZB62082.1 glyoxalase [Thalassospira lucentensis]MBO9508062.1 VOC family protein [Thalassospira sp. A3_1]RCK46946.1 glyoxalase [Thalassospira xiamenensis]
MTDPNTAKASKTHGNIIPALHYDDAKAAIEFLCRAFGFEKHAIYQNEDGIVEHAELVLGNGMIMLGQARDSTYGKLTRRPNDIGGVTQSIYIIVPDADLHYARAVAASTEIVMPLEEQDYGGKVYSARDPEGHIWSFGTYDPFG